jgi:hypothetical protein
MQVGTVGINNVTGHSVPNVSEPKIAVARQPQFPKEGSRALTLHNNAHNATLVHCIYY